MLEVVKEHGEETFLNHFEQLSSRRKLEQAEAKAKMAEESKAAAEKKLKTTEQDISMFVFHFESRIGWKPEAVMLGFQKSVLFWAMTTFHPLRNGGGVEIIARRSHL